MKVYVKQLYDEKGNKIDVTPPYRGSESAAGYDIIATSDPKIVGHNLTPVGYESSEIDNRWISVDYIEYETNLYIAPSVVTTHTLIHPRSSISKYNLVLANSIGLIDNDYRGMVICRFKYMWQPEDFSIWHEAVDNSSHHPINISGRVNMNKIYKKGDKIAQLVFESTVQVEFELVDDLTQTQRGSGGFGSTDQPQETNQSSHKVKSITDKYLENLNIVVTPPKTTYSDSIKEKENQI
jgi:dUTPase